MNDETEIDDKSKNRESKSGFLKTFISVCSGTSVFPKLVGYPLFKAIWHLVLLAVICASANIAMRYHPFNVEFEKACADLQKRFGGVEYTSVGIVPEKLATKSGALMLEDLRVDYMPSLKKLDDFKPDGDFDYGIVWTPRSIFLWARVGDKPVPVLPLIVPELVDSSTLNDRLAFYWNRMQDQSESDSSLRSFAEMYEIPSTQTIKNDSDLFRDFKSNLMQVPLRLPTLYIFYLASEMLVNILIVSPLYILIFTMFSATLGKSEMLGLKFPQLLIIGIYTGMPGTVIATLYTILNLPYLDFQSVFLIAYLVYSFPVFGRMRLNRMKKNSPTPPATPGL